MRRFFEKVYIDLVGAKIALRKGACNIELNFAPKAQIFLSLDWKCRPRRRPRRRPRGQAGATLALRVLSSKLCMILLFEDINAWTKRRKVCW